MILMVTFAQRVKRYFGKPRSDKTKRRVKSCGIRIDENLSAT